MRKVTEFVNVKINSTEEELVKAMIGSILEPYINMIERYGKAIEMYENDGFIIKNKDTTNFTFVAEKTYYTE